MKKSFFYSSCACIRAASGSSTAMFAERMISRLEVKAIKFPLHRHYSLRFYVEENPLEPLLSQNFLSSGKVAKVVKTVSEAMDSVSAMLS